MTKKKIISLSKRSTHDVHLGSDFDIFWRLYEQPIVLLPLHFGFHSWSRRKWDAFLTQRSAIIYNDKKK